MDRGWSGCRSGRFFRAAMTSCDVCDKTMDKGAGKGYKEKKKQCKQIGLTLTTWDDPPVRYLQKEARRLAESLLSRFPCQRALA